ncbi:FBP domain-containing protein [Phycicoccus sp. BSK3Z-2]|uniref:FBP domain-containing protein n=1 Tax=Phycicoccus avicenniae TaxID=2828860 RepID=A0A941HYH5_9MICO|nr:FBP domain-containing protein [Phycicoccus avicenniae]MBR7741847.1 FBP domain-containing protein [Phycicoccus avicenniae]
MEPLTETQVRSSFVNATKGQISRMTVPQDLATRSWDDVDMLAWLDPKNPAHAHLVIPTPDHGPVGVRLKRATGGEGLRRKRMCSLCTTTHGADGVGLMVAPRAGRAGRDGNTVGVEMCTSLDCSLYARGLLAPPSATVIHETLSVESRVARLRHNLLTFVDRVMR